MSTRKLSESKDEEKQNAVQPHLGTHSGTKRQEFTDTGGNADAAWRYSRERSHIGKASTVHLHVYEMNKGVSTGTESR